MMSLVAKQTQVFAMTSHHAQVVNAVMQGRLWTKIRMIPMGGAASVLDRFQAPLYHQLSPHRHLLQLLEQVLYNQLSLHFHLLNLLEQSL